jgi:hypothetical protein
MSDRAVSEVISYVLVFGLIVSAVGIISVSGLSTLQDVRNDEQIANAERAFDIMSDNIEDIHRRGAPSRATEISLGEAELATGSNMTMRIEVDDTDDGSFNVDDSYERNIRPIIYRGEEERELVYEAGAVFRTNRDGGIIVEEPPLLIDEQRVQIPIIGLNRPQAQSLGGSTVLVRTQLQDRSVEYEDTGDNVEEIRIEITDSNHEDLWVEYLESEGFTDCQDISDGIQCDFNPDPSTIDIVYVVDYDIAVNIDP